MPRSCDFTGCDQPARSHGLCGGHAAQRDRKPDEPLTPLHATKRRDGEPPRIIYDEIPCPNPNLDGPCHVFRGAKISQGYGTVASGIGKDLVLVHRYVWEQTNGPIPSGLEIDHQCRNRACCNVLHLRVVTRQVNATENSDSVAAKNAVKTHCPSGHEYTTANTYNYKGGGRMCRTCNRNRARRKAGYKQKEVVSCPVSTR